MRAKQPEGVELIGRALGSASLAIGVGALMAPGRLGRLLGVDRSTVWTIGVRDLASAWMLLGPGGSQALLARALFDLGDAVMMARRRRLLACLAAAASLIALAGGTSARRR